MSSLKALWAAHRMGLRKTTTNSLCCVPSFRPSESVLRTTVHIHSIRFLQFSLYVHTFAICSIFIHDYDVNRLWNPDL